jgi:hypothetical protein
MSAAHLAVLSAFAIAQPLFDVLAKHAAFFVVRDSTAAEIVVFAVVVTLGPPLVLTAIEALAGLAGSRPRQAVHVAFVAALVALLALQVAKRNLDVSTWPIVGVAVLTGATAAAIYMRAPAVRSMLTVLVPAPAVFAALFLFTSPVSKLVMPADASARLADVAASTPVVVVIFDEFPTASLEDRPGHMDQRRFPNIAELAGTSTWFVNSTTVSGNTIFAVPALLTGRTPVRGRLPIFADHPRSIFTLLGGRYRMHVAESLTRLCPAELCTAGSAGQPATGDSVGSLLSDVGVIYGHIALPPGYERRLPPIDETWGDFGEGVAPTSIPDARAGSAMRPTFGEATGDRARQFASFVDTLRPSRRPSLSVIHSLLPHAPWSYLPSGRSYAIDRGGIPGRTGDRWGTEPAFVREAYQRHLLQVGFVDRLVGRLVARLRAIGLYERSLIILTADHGVSLRAGLPRRFVIPENVHDIAFQPLIVKEPGQRSGRVVARHVTTLDIVPTIADVLNIRIPWDVDGTSVFRPRRAGEVRIAASPVVARLDELRARRAEEVRRKTRMFGSGPWSRLFAAGPNAELVGRALRSFDTVVDPDSLATVDAGTAAALCDLPRRPAVLPSPIFGSVQGAPAGVAIAIAVNGRIRATTTTALDGGRVVYAALVPEAAFRHGRNRVEIYSPAEGERLSRLGELRC